MFSMDPFTRLARACRIWSRCAAVAIACAPLLASAAGTSIDPNQQGISGAWYNPASSGQGFMISVTPNADGAGHANYFGGWFTYADPWSGEYWGQPLNTPMWLSLQGSTATVDATYGVALNIYDNDGRGGNFNALPKIGANLLGKAWISLSDCSHMHLHYTVQYRADFVDPQFFDMDLVRLMPSMNCVDATTTNPVDSNFFGLSGAWYNPATSGQGFAFEVNEQGATGQFFGGWFTYADQAAYGNPTGRRWYSLQGPIQAQVHSDGDPVLLSVTTDVYATSGGVFATPNAPGTVITREKVGSARVDFYDCSTASVTYSFTGGENAFLSGVIPLNRLGPTPAVCAFGR